MGQSESTLIPPLPSIATSTLKMETICFSETLVSTYKSIWYPNPEEHHLQFNIYLPPVIPNRLSHIPPWHIIHLTCNLWLIRYLTGITSALTYCWCSAELLSASLDHMVVYADGSFVQGLTDSAFIYNSLHILTEFLFPKSVPSAKLSCSFCTSCGNVILCRLPKCLSESPWFLCRQAHSHWDSMPDFTSPKARELCCVLLDTWSYWPVWQWGHRCGS
jgi:hypothetical protein